MSSIPSVGKREVATPTTNAASGPRPIDIWLDSVHRLAQGRAAERAGLAAAGRELRSRLHRTE